MKNKIGPLLIAALPLYALIVAGCQSVPQPVQTSAQKQNSKCAGRVELGKYGTLKCLRTSEGKDISAAGEKKMIDGYAIGYQHKESAAAKPVEKIVYALADEHSDNLVEVSKKLSSATENSAEAVVKTGDNDLQIIYRTSLCDKTGLLGVQLVIEVLNPKKAQLSFAKLLASDRLIGTHQLSEGQYVKDALSQVRRAVAYLGPYQDCFPSQGCLHGGVASCPNDPPCPEGACCDGRPCPDIYLKWRLNGFINTFDNAVAGLKTKDSGKSDSYREVVEKERAATFHTQASGRGGSTDPQQRLRMMIFTDYQTQPAGNPVP